MNYSQLSFSQFCLLFNKLYFFIKKKKKKKLYFMPCLDGEKMKGKKKELNVIFWIFLLLWTVNFRTQPSFT